MNLNSNKPTHFHLFTVPKTAHPITLNTPLCPATLIQLRIAVVPAAHYHTGLAVAVGPGRGREALTCAGSGHIQCDLLGVVAHGTRIVGVRFIAEGRLGPQTLPGDRKIRQTGIRGRGEARQRPGRTTSETRESHIRNQREPHQKPERTTPFVYLFIYIYR